MYLPNKCDEIRTPYKWVYSQNQNASLATLGPSLQIKAALPALGTNLIYWAFSSLENCVVYYELLRAVISCFDSIRMKAIEHICIHLYLKAL